MKFKELKKENKELKDETGSLEKALARYKGSIKNYEPVEHTIEIKRLIKI